MTLSFFILSYIDSLDCVKFYYTPSLTGVKHLPISLIQKNADRKCELKKLRVKSIIDAVMYTQELNRIEKQNEEARREIQNLGNIESGLMLRETEKLLHFIDTADMQDTYNEELFLSFVDSIIVYSRDSIGFKLKCGLTLKEALCTDTRS